MIADCDLDTQHSNLPTPKVKIMGASWDIENIDDNTFCLLINILGIHFENMITSLLALSSYLLNLEACFLEYVIVYVYMCALCVRVCMCVHVSVCVCLSVKRNDKFGPFGHFKMLYHHFCLGAYSNSYKVYYYFLNLNTLLFLFGL